MPETFNCPNCGAPLDYKGSDPIIRCPYCNSSVVVPENLRSRPSFSQQPHNFTLSGVGDMGGLINQARRFKEVKDLAQAGNMDEAVRIYSEITGQDAENSRTAVQNLANGQPITLSGMKLVDFAPSIGYSTRVVTAPDIRIKPVDEQASKKVMRTVGCGIGCFVVALALFILVTTLVPVAGGLAGILVGLKPDLVQTALPGINIVGGGFTNKESSFGGEGTGPGLFEDVRAIAINPASGEIYAADYSGGRVQKFDPHGKFITQWILEGKNTYISAINADRKGNVFILASGKLLRYNGDGKFLGSIKVGNYNRIDDTTLTADGSLVGTSGDDIIHFDSNGDVINMATKTISGAGGNENPDGKIAVDGRGNIFILESFDKAIYKFVANGKFINRFGSDGDEPGQFSAPYAIAVDGKGQVYVSDTKGVQVFSNDGRYINVIDIEYYAYGLAFDNQGRLYATTNQKKIDIFSFSKR